MTRIAIMGGTFDPIHNAHLAAAQAVYEELQMDRILFIPSGDPPHKPACSVTSAEDRYQMVRAAIADNPAFDVSRMEIDRPGRTYSIDTVQELRGKLPKDTKLYFILGADAFHDLWKWHRADEFRYACAFIAVTRPGYPAFDHLSDWYSGVEYQALTIPSVDLSSTMLRERVGRGQSIRYLVPEAVRKYMEEHHLYESVKPHAEL